MPDAVPHCPHFGRCGGCSLLDQPIEQQLLHKQARARELLRPWLDGNDPTITLPPRPPRHDRISLLYPVQRQLDRIEVGIYRRGTHEIEPIRDCRVQHKALTRFGVRAAELLNDLAVEPYDERRDRGVLRALRARVMPQSRELLVGFVATRAAFPGRDHLAKGLERIAQDLRCDQGHRLDLVGVAMNVNDRPGNALLGHETIALHGRAWQQDRIGALSLRVSFASFYQLHRYAEAILFRPAMALLGDVRGLRVVDGYGGVGAFALRLLQAGAAAVTLIEASPDACADARHNFTANGFGGTRVDGDGAFEGAQATVREEPFGASPLPPCDLLLADPPRKGLQDTGVAAVLAAQPARVLLVSCALEALARDLAALAPSYRVTTVQLCDLFPHTEHVEALTLFERRQ